MQKHIFALLKDSKQHEIASPSITWFITTVILLQTVKVGRGTHLVKNYESQSRANKTQLKTASPKLKTLGPLCNSYIL